MNDDDFEMLAFIAANAISTTCLECSTSLSPTAITKFASSEVARPICRNSKFPGYRFSKDKTIFPRTCQYSVGGS